MSIYEMMGACHREQKEYKQQKHQIMQLLLEGESAAMEIKEHEIIITGEIYKENGWVATINENKITTSSFSDTFQKVIEIYEPKAVQLVPYSVKKRCVNCYLIMLTIIDPEYIKAENEYMEMLDKLTLRIRKEAYEKNGADLNNSSVHAVNGND